MMGATLEKDGKILINGERQNEIGARKVLRAPISFCLVMRGRFQVRLGDGLCWFYGPAEVLR